MLCPSCGGKNEEGAEVCFHCRAVLLAVTRGAVIASRYEVLSPVGRGGMGEVYRARDRVLDEEVALKVLRVEGAGHDSFARRFLAEIRLARKVSHPNVCRIHDYGEEGALRWISMELVSGENLREVLGRRGPLPPGDVLAVAIQAARGLQAIHEAGVVHRDLSAQNLMLDASGRVRVMDFGIAKPAAEGATEGGARGYLLGNPEYVSPEQARGRAVDARSDVYSLGVVLYELLAGAPPFRGDTPVGTLLLHLEAEPPLDRPGVPEPFRPVLARCLAKDPAARFASARELVAALEALRGDKGPDEGPRTRRRVSPSLVTAAVLVVLGLTLALLSRPWSKDPPPRDQGVPRSSPNPSPSDSIPITVPSAPPAVPSPSSSATARPTPRAPAGPTASPPARATAPDANLPPPALPEPAPAPSVTPPPPTPSPEVADGSLLVLVTPWADVSVDGVPKGQTPLARLALPAGSHAVLLTHPEYEPFPRRVTVLPGETYRLVVDLPTEGVRRSR